MSQNPRSKLMSNGVDFVKTIHNDTYDFIEPDQFDLRGKAVFVTGASKGCGRAIAVSFARAGTSFIGIGARSSLDATEKAIHEAAQAAGRPKPTILAIKQDVTSQDSVAASIKEVESAFGRLDFLINNAGYLEDWKPLAESEIDEWWKTQEANVKGTYLCTRAFLPLMLKGGNKTILNTASVGAHLAAPGASSYQSSKFWVCRFSEFINADYGDQGVLALSYHPGGVATELALGMPEAMHMHLVDTPALCGDSVVWLLAERREWLAGRYLSVNWDMQQVLDKKERIVKEDLLKVRLDVGLD